MNAEGSVPQDAAFFRTYATTTDTSDWRSIGAGLTARSSRRADVGQGSGALPDTPSSSARCRCPMTARSRFCGLVRRHGRLPRRAGTGRPPPAPGWHLRLKEHPRPRRPSPRFWRR
ncbi:hypothetical protein ACFSHQ_08020 [Gemmobacter lanyuensis]